LVVMSALTLAPSYIFLFLLKEARLRNFIVFTLLLGLLVPFLLISIFLVNQVYMYGWSVLF
jgi:hypothetical protein